MLYKSLNLTSIFFLILSTQSCSANKNEIEDKDTQQFLHSIEDSDKKYTILDKNELIKNISESNLKIIKLIHNVSRLKKEHEKSGYSKIESNENIIRYLAKELDGINYSYTYATGEWNGTSNSKINISCEGKNTCVQQTPVYRTDTVDCFTLVNLIIAILNSNNLNEFKKNIVKISYGAYYSTLNEEKRNELTTISFFNRNHFTIPDWTNINEKNGFISNFTNPINGTQQVDLKSTITRSNWFFFNLNDPLKRDKELASKITVFNDNLGESALKYFNANNIKSLQSILDKNKSFELEDVITNYIPTSLSIHHIDEIPTPSVVGIVRDPTKWNIKNLIGTEYTISHVGIAYKEIFNHGDLIYRDMVCSAKDGDNPRNCNVNNYLCGENNYKTDTNNQCKVTMLLNATRAYPDYYFYYAKNDGTYACTKDKPNDTTIVSTCNRAMSIPLKAYMEKNQEISSVLGIHVENIL